MIKIFKVNFNQVILNVLFPLNNTAIGATISDIGITIKSGKPNIEIVAPLDTGVSIHGCSLR